MEINARLPRDYPRTTLIPEVNKALGGAPFRSTSSEASHNKKGRWRALENSMQATGRLYPVRGDLHKLALARSIAVVSLVAIAYAGYAALGMRLTLAPLLSAIFLLALFDAPLFLRLGDAAPVTELHAWSVVTVWLLCYAAEEIFCIAPPNFATWIVPAAGLAWFGARLNEAGRAKPGCRGANSEQQARERYLIGLAGAAHEIGTPLSTMCVLVAELRRSRTPPGDWNKTIEVLWEQIQVCRRSLSDLARYADAEHLGEPRSISAKHLVLDAASRFQALRPTVDLKLWCPRLDDSFLVDNDHTLSQAVVNFLNNAADASPGSVELRVVQKSKSLVLHVLDRGTGIAPQLRNRIGKGPVTTKAAGRGVGMLIAHAAIERYGSSIRISDRPFGGSCVRIELPIFRVDRQSAEEHHGSRIVAG
jgi:signal transduction histidine kinase